MPRPESYLRYVLVAMFLLLVTGLSFWSFPGTTFCEEDSQIYLPILQKQLDPSLLGQDLITQYPHTAFSFYDELITGVAAGLHLDLETSMRGLQFLFRFILVLGFFLMGKGLALSDEIAAAVAGLLLLGGSIPGPSINVVELEPIPRTMATAMLFMAIGLISLRRLYLGTTMACLGYWLHPTTTLPFWVGWLLVLLTGHLRMGNKQRLLLASLPTAATGILLLVALRVPSEQSRYFLSFIDPQWEALLWMRTRYDFVSAWSAWQFTLLAGTGMILVLAWMQNRTASSGILRKFIGPTSIWAYSMLPLSWLLLDHSKLALLAQVQPARAVAFPVIWMLFLSWATGFKALCDRRRLLESMLWLAGALAFVVDQPLLLLLWPLLGLEALKNVLLKNHRFSHAQPWFQAGCLTLQLLALAGIIRFKPFGFDALSTKSLAELGCLAVVAVLLGLILRRETMLLRWRGLALGLTVAAVFLVVPAYLRKPSQPSNPAEVYELADWARSSTPPEAVFLFPDAGRAKYPGYFRFRAARAVFVDWKGGGQINFSRRFSEEWWRRWQTTMTKPLTAESPAQLKSWKIGFVVTKEETQTPGFELVHQTSAFYVYRLP